MSLSSSGYLTASSGSSSCDADDYVTEIYKRQSHDSRRTGEATLAVGRWVRIARSGTDVTTPRSMEGRVYLVFKQSITSKSDCTLVDINGVPWSYYGLDGTIRKWDPPFDEIANVWSIKPISKSDVEALYTSDKVSKVYQAAEEFANEFVRKFGPDRPFFVMAHVLGHTEPQEIKN